MMLGIWATSSYAEQPTSISKKQARSLLKKVYRARYKNARCMHCKDLEKPAKKAGFKIRKKRPSNAKWAIRVAMPRSFKASPGTAEYRYKATIVDATTDRKDVISTEIGCKMVLDYNSEKNRQKMEQCEAKLLTKLHNLLQNIAYPKRL